MPTETIPFIPTQSTARKTTVTANLLLAIQIADDEEAIVNLLELFDRVDARDLPIPQLVEIALTTTAETPDLWLATHAMEIAWEKFYELLAEDADRIPPEPVYAALRHAIDQARPDEDEQVYALLWTTRLALLAHRETAPFPEDIVQRLIAHPWWEARQLAIEVLSELDRTDAILPLIADDDPDVARDAILALPWSEASVTSLAALVAHPAADEGVRQAAGARIAAIQKYLAHQMASA